MAENSSHSSSIDEMKFSDVFVNNYDNYFTKSCRTCSLLIKDNVYIDSFQLNTKEISLHDKLYFCFPEFDLRPNSKTILCLNCSKVINIIYEFNYKYDKSKGLLHSNLPFSLPFIPNVHLFNNCGITIEDEIKTEEIDLFDTEISMNVHEQIQSIKNSEKYLQSNMKTTVCIVEGLSKHSQWNDIYKNISKENSPIHAEEGSLKYSHRNYRDKPYKCSQCDFRTAYKSSLLTHFCTHSGDKPFKCCQCDYNTTLKNCLISHFHSHTGDKPFKCFHCYYSTPRKNSLIRHFRSHTGDKPFKCFHCDYSTAHKNCLVNHFGTHTKDKPFKCSHCDYSTAHKICLVHHFRIHTGDKPFKCSQCDFKAARRDSLVSHFRTHTREKPYKCSQCDYRCSQKSHLNRHFRTHTGDKPFKCSICNFRTARSTGLVTHFRTHTGDKPFKCSHCDFITAHKISLVKHFRTHT